MTTQEEINILKGANKLLDSENIDGVTKILIIERINDVISSLESKNNL